MRMVEDHDPPHRRLRVVERGTEFLAALRSAPRWDLSGPATRRSSLTLVPPSTLTPHFEVLDVDASIDQITAAPPLKEMPMAVISKTLPFPLPPEPSDLGPPLETGWLAGQESLVALGHNTPHVVAPGSDHYVHVRQPDLVAAITMLVIGRITTS